MTKKCFKVITMPTLLSTFCICPRLLVLEFLVKKKEGKKTKIWRILLSF